MATNGGVAERAGVDAEKVRNGNRVLQGEPLVGDSRIQFCGIGRLAGDLIVIGIVELQEADVYAQVGRELVDVTTIKIKLDRIAV
jgi:hypothetical protein